MGDVIRLDNPYQRTLSLLDLIANYVVSRDWGVHEDHAREATDLVLSAMIHRQFETITELVANEAIPMQFRKAETD